MKLQLGLGVFLLSLLANAAGITGGIDIRPSWVTKTGEFRTENNISLGIQTESKVDVSLVHNFNANLFQPVTEQPSGLTPSAVDAYAKLGLPPVWKSVDANSSLSYSARAYLPIQEASRGKGQITAIRNYLTLKNQLTSSLALSLVEVPIVHLYSRAGSPSGEGEAANPILENRIYAIADLQISDKLALSVPVMFHATRYRPYLTGSKNDNAMGYFLWVNPELSYSATNKVTIGLSYYSDNLIAGDLGGTALGTGLEDGVAQVSLAVSL